MARLAIPSNYVQSDGTGYDYFDSATGWTAGMTVDTTYVKENGVSLHVPLSTGFISRDKTISLDMTNADYISFWIYIPDPATVAAQNIFYLTADGFTSYFHCTINTAGWGGIVRQGWNPVTLRKSSFTNQGGATWTTMTTMRWQQQAADRGDFYVCDLVVGRRARAKLLIVSDSPYKSFYDAYVAYMKPLGLRGTMYVAGSEMDGWISASNPDSMSYAELDTFYDDGNDVGSIGFTHTDLTTLSTSQRDSDLASAKTWLKAKSYNRALNHMAYPDGGYNDAVKTAVQDAGFLTARTTQSTRHNYHGHGGIDKLALWAKGAATGVAQADMTNNLDTAIERGATAIHYFHKIHASVEDSITWLESKFDGYCSYVANKESLGLVDVVLMSEWEDGLTYPRLSVSSRLVA